MKKLIIVALLLSGCLATPALADKAVKDASGTNFNTCTTTVSTTEVTCVQLRNAAGTTAIDPATASNQSTANGSLATIATNTTGLATSANQTTANGSLATIATNTSAATPGGENHVGEFGNNIIALTATPTVTASSAYAAGNAVGGLVTLTGATRVSGTAGAGGTSGSVQSLIVSSKSSQGALSDVVIFNANPTGSTCTDKTAFSLAAADIGKVVGVVHMTDWVSMGTASMGQAQNQAMPYILSSSTTLYACFITRGTPTFTSTSDIAIALNVFRN